MQAGADLRPRSDMVRAVLPFHIVGASEVASTDVVDGGNLCNDER